LTCIVLMFVAGGLMWANLSYRSNCARGTAGISCHGRISSGTAYADGYGWPWPYFVFWDERNPFTTSYDEWRKCNIAWDCLVAVALFILAATFFELRPWRKLHWCTSVGLTLALLIFCAPIFVDVGVPDAASIGFAPIVISLGCAWLIRRRERKL